MARRVTGKVSRFGGRGFGFIESRELDRAAWFHVRLLRDVEAVPQVGDEVEFDVLTLPDGRIQAHDVAPAGSGPRPATRQSESPTARSPLRARLQLPLSLVEDLRKEIATAGVEPAKSTLVAVAEPAPESIAVPEAPPEEPPAEVVDVEPTEPPRPGSMGERVQEILGDTKRKRTEVEAAADQLEAECRLSEERIALVRADAERRIRKIIEEREEKEHRAEQLRAEAALIVVKPEERRAAWSTALRERSAGITATLVDRARALRDRETARKSAVVALGEATVKRYEEVRRRARDVDDPIAAEAYGFREAALRSEVARYAEALDAAEKTVRIAIPVAVAAARQQVVAALPLLSADLLRDPCWRVAAAFANAMEQAARDVVEEEGGPPLYGEVDRCIAARLAGDLDVELFELLLGEAWVARPTLTELGIVFEVEKAPSLEFALRDTDDHNHDADEPEGGSLPAMAVRLGLSLSEAVAALIAHGMPFPDDTVEPGVEASLRTLLGASTEEEVREELPAATITRIDRSSPAAIASRMLLKLLRDGRVGGRHTRIEHAYGHHFADNEKQIAHRVAERLLVMGILRKKLNEGTFHVYIDPRKLREVWAIINMSEGAFE
ncbi:MAG: cold shock domain-containing protein [Proteobacteria bacterium]|jgi:cold shock CspA family protein|nr:cold shock domain-containing protein [Pseudomonadota bacterium]